MEGWRNYRQPVAVADCSFALSSQLCFDPCGGVCVTDMAVLHRCPTELSFPSVPDPYVHRSLWTFTAPEVSVEL